MNAVAPSRCPVCQTGLPVGELAGLCPACAWRELAGVFEDAPDEVPASPGILFSVAGHEVIEEIARGGAGIVYRARQREPRREVALKMLLPQQLGSPEMRTRFHLEAETIAALEHPAILPVYTVGEYDGLPFFTMKLAPGGTLAARRESFFRRWRELAALMAHLADAVQFAHTRGVIHRDVKPGNVLFDEEGGAYVSDFGLAKFTASTDGLTRSISVMGTPAYLAPEVIEHGGVAATTAGDVYGLGAIFYELLTGRLPFAADSLATLLREVMEGTPERPSRLVAGLPRDLEVICLRCLEKDPAKRLASAGALADDLRRWLSGHPIQARPISTAERAWRWAARNPALASLSVLLTIAVVGGGIVLARANRELSATVVQARAAEADAMDKLRQSLISEARLTRQSRRLGQHYDALALAERAGRMAPSVEARSEVAAALARPDLALVRRLPGFFPGQIAFADFTPDLSTYLTPAAQGGLELRSAVDGRSLRRYPLPPQVTSNLPRFSDDGRFFSVALSDLSTGFWETEREEAWWKLPAAPEGVVVKSALHPTKGLVAYRSPEHEVIIRDLRSGSERTLTAKGSRVFSLGFDPSGLRLAIVRQDSVSLVDVETGKEAWSEKATPIGLVPAWSPDGSRLATGNLERNEIIVRDAATGRAFQSLTGHSTFPTFIAFQPDGRRLVSMAFDRTLRLWDVANGREILNAALPTRGLRLATDGRQLGAAIDAFSPAVFAWAPEDVFREMSGRPGRGETTSVMDVSRDGSWVVTGVAYERDQQWFYGMRIWNARRDIEVGHFEFPAPGSATVWFQPDDRALIYGSLTTGLHRRKFTERSDGQIELAAEENLGASPDGILLGFGRENGEWLILRPKAGGLVGWPAGQSAREHVIHATPPNETVGISTNGKWATALPFRSAELRIRAIGSALVAEQKLPLDPDGRAFFSADSRWLLLAGEQGFRTWDLEKAQPGPAWKSSGEGEPRRLAAFSPDGRYLVTDVSRGTVEVRDAQSFNLLARLEPPADFEVAKLVWAPDNSRIYVLARGPRLFFWDIAALRQAWTARGLDW